MNKSAAKAFAKKWKNKGDEKQNTQIFWLDFIEKVLEIPRDSIQIDFEKDVAKYNSKGKNFRDVFIKAGKDKTILIEQKSSNVDLRKRYKQSDGEYRTPFEQAKHYDDEAPRSEKANWIIVSNFKEIWFYNMERSGLMLSKPVATIQLEDLSKYPEAFYMFFPDKKEPERKKRVQLIREEQEKKKRISFDKEVAISKDAGELIGQIYKNLKQAFEQSEPEADRTEDLNKLAVRLVFLLYSDSAEIPKETGSIFQFREFLADIPPRKIRRALLSLFEAMDTPKEEDRRRSLFPYLKDDDPELWGLIEEAILEVPYINGGLFKDKIAIPAFTHNLQDQILNATHFSWKDISPTIFGSIFESTLNPETRHSGGMHYTSIENIHKVIDPLFLDDLQKDLDNLLSYKQGKRIGERVSMFIDKLKSLKFLDPAMGSGNFLTETYLSLRKMENQALEHYLNVDRSNNISLQLNASYVNVKIDQFYGIEINDFAVSVAQAALWIAQHQMNKETEKIISSEIKFLPLTDNKNLYEGNALRMNWSDILEPDENTYLLSNPPYRGARFMNADQKSDMEKVFKGWKNVGDLDYVAAWFKKAADYMTLSKGKAAFVSTNSISQGTAVKNLWEPIFDKGIHFDFAYRSFIWQNGSRDEAHVHCVILGFSKGNKKRSIIFDEEGNRIEAKNINAYLLDGPDIFIDKLKDPLFGNLCITTGNQLLDDGNYVFSEDEMNDFLKKEPGARKFFHPYMSGKDFIDRKPRYCLWLGDATPAELKKLSETMKRMEKVREFRNKSHRKQTKKFAETPTRYCLENLPDQSYIAIPKISSQRRDYIPMGFINDDTFSSDTLHVLKGGELFHFGILESKLHMDWMRSFSGRLKSDYRYTIGNIYNTFPWPNPTSQQKQVIEETAQGILDARDLYPDSSLADLYDPLTMPPELRKAHQKNDRAVMKAYGFKPSMSESEILAKLFEMYQKKVEGSQ